MKTKTEQTEKNIKAFGFELLNNEEMLELRGGGRPRSQDRDMFDLEEDE